MLFVFALPALRLVDEETLDGVVFSRREPGRERLNVAGAAARFVREMRNLPSFLAEPDLVGDAAAVHPADLAVVLRAAVSPRARLVWLALRTGAANDVITAAAAVRCREASASTALWELVGAGLVTTHRAWSDVGGAWYNGARGGYVTTFAVTATARRRRRRQRAAKLTA